MLQAIHRRAATRQAVRGRSRQAAGHEDVADARPGRERRRGHADDGGPASQRGRLSHLWPVHAADEATPEGERVRHAREVRLLAPDGRQDGLLVHGERAARALLVPRRRVLHRQHSQTAQCSVVVVVEQLRGEQEARGYNNNSVMMLFILAN